jgi:hypothetical protein
MDRDLLEKNAESRERLLALVENLDDQTLQQHLDADWTIGAILAHVAFWDQLCVSRWDAYLDGGALADIPITLVHLINAANLPTWRALPGHTAVEVLRQAMEENDARVASLPDKAVQDALAGGFGFMVDRTSHRDEHVAEITAFLAR